MLLYLNRLLPRNFRLGQGVEYHCLTQREPMESLVFDLYLSFEKTGDSGHFLESPAMTIDDYTSSSEYGSDHNIAM